MAKKNTNSAALLAAAAAASAAENEQVRSVRQAELDDIAGLREATQAKQEMDEKRLTALRDDMIGYIDKVLVEARDQQRKTNDEVIVWADQRIREIQDHIDAATPPAAAETDKDTNVTKLQTAKPA